MKKLLSRWIAAIMVGVIVISSGVTGTVQAEGNHVETTEEKLQTDTEKNNSEIEGDLSVGDDATSQKEDDSVAEENNATESEIIEEGATNEENVGENPKSIVVSEETESEVPEEIEMALNYLYINEAEQQGGEQQSIVLSWGNENTEVNNISLTLENENGEQTILEATKKSDELYLYEHIFSQGVYHVSNVHVATDESEKDFTAEELEIDAYFGVGKTPNESAKSSYIEMESVEEGEGSANTAASVETSVVSIGENGEETAEASIGAALEAQGVTVRSGKARSARAKNVVVVLDPGHDSKHAGAYGNGVHEEVATLKIARYCKEELEQYGGITVYMTRESAACPFPNSKDNIDDIKQRTAWAKTKGADVFVSFHLNSNDSSSPNGAEVYYPKTSSGGAALAQKIQGELVSLGLKNRGTKANETLAVINSSMKNGFPGVLIEHAFVSNSSDANNYLNSDAKLKKLGVADAKGIASYFGLSKGSYLELDTHNYVNYIGTKYMLLARTNDKKSKPTISVRDSSIVRVEEVPGEDSRGFLYNLTGLKAGSTTITVKQNGVSDVLNVKYITPGDYTLDTSKLTLDIGDRYHLLAKVSDKIGDTPTVKSSNTSVATARLVSTTDSRGYLFEVVGVGEGVADITVTYQGVAKKMSVIVNGLLELDTHTYKGKVGQIYDFLVKTEDRKTYPVIEIEDKSIVSVVLQNAKHSRGFLYRIQGLKAGSTTITVKQNGKSDQLKVTYTGEEFIVDTSKVSIAEGKVYDFLVKNIFDFSMLTVESQDSSIARCELYSSSDKRGVVYRIYALKEGVTEIKVTCFGVEKFIKVTVTKADLYEISGKSGYRTIDLVNLYKKNSFDYPAFYKNSDAPTLEKFCQIYYEEAIAENIRPEVAFCQAMLETKWLQYGGDVKIEQYNFAGIGATGGGNPGNSFSSVRIGIRAQIQHLKAYAVEGVKESDLANPCVDPRFKYVKKGCAPYVEWLGIQENPSGNGWAAGKNYGYNILNVIKRL